MKLNRKIPDYPILVLNNKPEDAETFLQLSSYFHIQFDFCSDTQEAIRKVDESSYSAFVCCLHPGQSGYLNLIFHIKGIYKDPLVLIISDYVSRHWLQELKRLGTFDILFTPIDHFLLKNVLSRLLEYAYFKEMEQKSFEEEASRIKGVLGSVLSNKALGLDIGSHAERSIYNLKTSLSQGSGFGVMVSLVDMIKMSVRQEGSEYRIDSSFLDILFENNEHSRKVLEELHFVVDILNSDIQLNKVTIFDLQSSFKDGSSSIVDYAKKKGLEIVFNFERFLTNRFFIETDLPKLLIALNELLVNSAKFSKNGTTIDVSTTKTESNYCIMIENTISSSTGIPFELEKLVLEPFFRIHPPVEDAISVEKIGFGLGLTLVEYIVSKHKGYFSIHNQSVDKELQEIKILSEIYIPIAK
jgi:signal transduction histidine kinase